MDNARKPLRRKGERNVFCPLYKLFGRRWKEGLLTQSYSNPLEWKIFKGQSKERWRPENENLFVR